MKTVNLSTFLINLSSRSVDIRAICFINTKKIKERWLIYHFKLIYIDVYIDGSRAVVVWVLAKVLNWVNEWDTVTMFIVVLFLKLDFWVILGPFLSLNILFKMVKTINLLSYIVSFIILYHFAFDQVPMAISSVAWLDT